MLFFLSVLISACQSIVPATSPAQLEHTPGIALTITDNQIDTGWFSLDYPDGWRVITNEAVTQLRLILVSPDDEMLIYIYDARNGCIYPENTPDASIYDLRNCIGDEGLQLQISGHVSIEKQADFDAIFEGVINSIDFR